MRRRRTIFAKLEEAHKESIRAVRRVDQPANCDLLGSGLTHNVGGHIMGMPYHHLELLPAICSTLRAIDRAASEPKRGQLRK
jgi:hypothetical protein